MTDTGPEMSLDRANEAVAAQTFPRVTEISIDDKIARVNYYFHTMTTGGKLTICVIEMQNGFAVQGAIATVDPRNHDEEIGKRYAFENAFRQLWPLEGYLLREMMYQNNIDKKVEKEL